MSQNDLAIGTKRLTMFYGNRRGIIDLDLTVRRGEVFGFLGPNEKWKSVRVRATIGDGAS